MNNEPTSIDPEYARQNPNWNAPKTDLEALQGDAFAAGWDAGLCRYSGWLVTHGVTDIRPGLEEAWQRYRAKESQGIKTGGALDARERKLSRPLSGKRLNKQPAQSKAITPNQRRET